MYSGKIMEIGLAEEIIDQPLHPYSKALQSAIPIPDPSFKRDRLDLIDINENSVRDFNGCCYQPRCQQAKDICHQVLPKMKKIKHHRYVACHLY
jgi:oligopeptide/dipeptide ABC transporter ATP-binding protein